MALLLRWRKTNIALLDQPEGGSADDGQLIDQIGLDFELGPLAFTFDEERHRFLAALTQLKSSTAEHGDQVDLSIPADWGIAHQVPNADLPAGELEAHLQWELSKAVVDSQEQYRYNYLVGSDGVIVMTALRIQLLDAINQLMQDSGFSVRGVFLDGEPWSRVNIADSRAHSEPEAVLPTKEDQGETDSAADIKASYRERHKRKASGARVFLVIILAFVLIGAGFVTWKFFLQKPADDLPQQVAQQPAVSQDEPETSPSAIPPPDQQEQPTSEATVQWADMSQRLGILSQVMNTFSGVNTFDLISFTENHFFCQLIGPDQGDVQNTSAKIQQISGLSQFKLSPGTLSMGVYRSTLNASIVVQQNGTMVAASKEGLIALAKQHGISNRDLIFTGSHADVMAFLSDIANHRYAIYRLIITPWGENQYRTVLEL
ncbi:hypothetical protein KJ564_11535 [bacterium]|nr:hypothetical protein [bacterium]